jgi:hypothetical protein
MNKLIAFQFVVLLIGTLFSWFQFSDDLLSWLNNKDCSIGCVENVSSPFIGLSFYGALLFTAGFVLNILIGKKEKVGN